MGELIKFRRPIYDSNGTDWSEVLDINNIVDLAYSDIINASKYYYIKYMIEIMPEFTIQQCIDVFKTDNYIMNNIVFFLIILLLVDYKENVIIEYSVNQDKCFTVLENYFHCNNKENVKFDITLTYNYHIKDNLDHDDHDGIQLIFQFQDDIIIFLLSPKYKLLFLNSYIPLNIVK